MQSRYLLAIYVFALIVAVVFAQQADQDDSILEKLKHEFKKEVEKIIHASVHGIDVAIQCVQEADRHCKGLSKSIIDFAKCSVQYIKDNREECQKNAE